MTLRASRHAPCLRRQVIFSVVLDAIRKSSGRWFQVVHFSVQQDHLHLIVEATDRVLLSRGMATLAIRVARAVNARAGRKGSLWGDRYHARPLRSPREVRHAIVYVLMNWRKHVGESRGIDPCSSAFWFDGWKVGQRPRAPPEDEAPVQPASTWLASTGWRRHGLVGLDERPSVARM